MDVIFTIAFKLIEFKIANSEMVFKFEYLAIRITIINCNYQRVCHRHFLLIQSSGTTIKRVSSDRKLAMLGLELRLLGTCQTSVQSTSVGQALRPLSKSL